MKGKIKEIRIAGDCDGCEVVTLHVELEGDLPRELSIGDEVDISLPGR
ncbi:MAG: hypothetical protein ABR999_10625 [Methanoregula sp.]|jgi:hypothetical protein